MPQISEKYHKDYKSFNFENPRLLKARENRKRILKKVIVYFGIIIVLSLIYLLFFSPVFIIKEIEINGLEKIGRANLNKIIDEYRQSRALFVFPRNNLWTFSRTGLKERVYKHYYFDKFDIKKKLFNKIIIALKEKESAINWLTNNLCFHLDLTGTAIEYCETDKGLLTVLDQRNKELQIGDMALEKEELAQLLELNSQLKALSQFRQFTLEKENKQVTVNMEEILQIKFDMTNVIGEQVARLKALLDNKDFNSNLKKFKYIDLRFGEKVYYQ